ncbi:Gfo/Idh/MocA family protein [Cytobacillus firmus]|uniref:Gfo/Idh/MocA family protein n=1 Tax=Cytobacillus firmus TaxID=1399 RepID=UPI0018CCD013|nr:Gfo/Idh/MocA family oxidoreductase [Cytobacillus firmus]MBG9656441.1 oxidoreductase [Cytobacillus firmus]MED1905319.1 Gfo/Idh/MocA family oxidoreductase [Cytobacillus firmus]
MVRFGIVGTNWITERFLKAALQAEDFQLTAVYSRTEEKAKKFAGNYGVERTFTDLQTMAASGEIDAVYIASPNSLHAEQAIIFMKHNVHVLCEKPIASNIKELQTMIAAARENNVLLMEALKSTFMPNFLAVKENLHKIGQVRRYFASYCQYSSRYDAYRQGTVLNAFNPEFSNGSIMDIGIYCIYPLVALFGKPEEIKAAGYKLESGVDGEGSIVLKYPDMDAVIMYSKITNSSLPSEIQGEEGNIVIDKISTPEKVELHYRNGEKEDLTQDQLSDSMYYEAKEFIRLVQAGKTESDINSFANSMITMEIIEEARRQIGVVYPADRN